MGSFYYEAINRTGDPTKGKVEADNESAAAERLRSMDLMVTVLKEAKQSALSGLSQPKAKAKLGDLSLFSRQLAAMINSGIPLTRALFTLSKQVNNPGFGKALTEIAQNVEGGSSLSEALKGYPQVFNNLYVNMVEAGEASGNLEATLERLSLQLQKNKELRDSIKSATFYPIAVLGFAVVTLFGMLFFLVPIFVGFFPEGAELPLPTVIIIAVSDFVRHYWFLVIPSMILLMVGAKAFINSKNGKKFIDRITYRMPIFGALIQKTVIASFARTFSTMLTTGVPVVQALDASGKATGHTLIMEATATAGEKIQEGSNVSNPLEESGVFSPMVTHMISVGEETGDVSTMMDKVADFFEEEVATMTKGLTSLIEPLMLVVIGLVVGGMLIALYLPIFTVITQI